MIDSAERDSLLEVFFVLASVPTIEVVQLKDKTHRPKQYVNENNDTVLRPPHKTTNDSVTLGFRSISFTGIRKDD